MLKLNQVIKQYEDLQTDFGINKNNEYNSELDTLKE